MDDSDVIQIKDIEIRSEIPIKIQEASSANGDTAGKGQIWVKNDTPNNLYFTNDAGNDVEASDIWRIVRFAKRIPYSGTITKVITHVESSGASADSDIEIGVWIASISSLSLDTQLATTTNVAIDNLAKIDFDFDTATRFMFKETTSFNATSLTASDFMFITMRRTSGTDGSSFNCHTTVLYEGS